MSTVIFDCDHRNIFKYCADVLEHMIVNEKVATNTEHISNWVTCYVRDIRSMCRWAGSITSQEKVELINIMNAESTKTSIKQRLDSLFNGKIIDSNTNIEKLKALLVSALREIWPIKRDLKIKD